MKLSDAQLEQLLELALAAAGRAGEYIRAEAGKPREVMGKQAGDTLASQVVTEVDFESQRLILEVLGESLGAFELGVLTEEGVDDASRHDRDFFWCIDPLDGTLPFTENVAGYSVSIALVSRAGVPVIGVIQDPVTGHRYHALLRSGCFRNGEPLVSGEARELTLVMDRSFANQDGYDRLLDDLRGIAADHGLDGLRIVNQGGAAMNACWVIEQAPAVYFKFPKPKRGGGALWDFAAAACLFGELDGAQVSDFSGAPLQLNREGDPYMNRDGVVFASSESLWRAVRELRP